MHIQIKPLSVNKCWQGRRFKTKAYKDYEKEFLWELRNVKEKYDGYVWIDFRFYINNFACADENNFLKAVFDILTKSKIIKDDRFVVGHTSRKYKIDKGISEFIEIFIEEVKT